MILTNALYFKGDWATKFDPANTKETGFYVTPNQMVTIPMMTQTAEYKYAQFRELKCKMLEIPYKGGSVAMQFILPDAHEDLSTIEQNINTLVSKFPLYSSKRKISVALPKFKIMSKMELKEPLERLNQHMKDLFSGHPDFSKMTKARGLQISRVIQDVFIEVNEEGSEAAAATAVFSLFKSRSIVTPFNMNHPFIFFIRDINTGLVLFQGRVNDPSI